MSTIQSSARRALVGLAWGTLLSCTQLESGDDLLERDARAPIDGEAAAPDGELEEAGADQPDAGPADDGERDGGCDDPQGFGGLGCYRCSPTDLFTLENACTDATCNPFNNTVRLAAALVDGGLPALPSRAPESDGGAPASDAGPAYVPPDTECSAIASGGTAVYVTGSTAAKPFLQLLGPQLATQGVTMIYTSTGSCAGVDAVLNGTSMLTGAAPLPASATYWDGPTSPGLPCRLPAEGERADIGISDVFAQSCAGFELADLDALRVRDAHGPVQTMTFAVPANSRHAEISAEAAYLVFGFGASAGVVDEATGEPVWADEALLLPRSPSSGTQALLAAAIGLPAVSWKGRPHATSDDVARDLLNAAATQADADNALGIIGADYLQIRNLRAQIRPLAFQDTRQACAVYPDSTATARDKRNVRDGHYPLWGPLHLLHRVDADGNPQRAESRQAVGDIIRYLSGTKALPNGLALIDLYAESGLVPECAMSVTRSADGGNIVPARPELPCSCLFELRAAGKTSCAACRVQGDCAAGHTCSLGYCELSP